MNHTTKFRGKILYGPRRGEWVFGHYFMHTTPEETLEHIIRQYSEDFIGYTDYEVDPKTVGQYLNVKDRLKNEVYDGDIISMGFEYHYESEFEINEDVGRYTGVVTSLPSKGVVLRNPLKESDLKDEGGIIKGYRYFRIYRSQIIGNIHDNPDLLTQ